MKRWRFRRLKSMVGDILLLSFLLMVFSPFASVAYGLDGGQILAFQEESFSNWQYKSWKQDDALWADQPISTYSTMKSGGCAITACAILIAHAGQMDETKFNPLVFLNYLQKQYADFNGNMNWTSYMKDFGMIKGSNYNFPKGATIEERTAIIDDFLKQGYYIIIPFLASEQSRSHYVAVDRVEDGVAYMFDPGFSATVLYEKFSTEDDLARNTYLIPYKPVNILAHQHDYYETYEENHPHKIMMKCKTCSNFYYTGKNKVLTDCRQCKIDNCQHQYLKGHDDAHPHKVFMKCSKCQSLTYTNELFQDKNCPICQKEIAKAEAAKIRFDDLQKYPWAEEAIYDLTRQCVIKGLDKDSFGPDKNIKRADYLCMLMRMLDAEAEIKNNFSDVGKDNYYYHEIGVAKALGLTDGRGNNLFMPEQFLSRQDMFVMAARILEKYQVIGKIDKADIAVLKQFTDQSSIADYAKKPIAALVSKKLVKGLNGEIDPLTNANRAQTAVFVDRLKGLLVK